MSVTYLLWIVLGIGIGGPILVTSIVRAAAWWRPDVYKTPFGDSSPRSNGAQQ